MYPPTKDAARSAHATTETALAELTRYCLDLWLPLVENAVLAAVEPPADAQATTEVESQWQYLVETVVVYALVLIAMDAMRTAYSSLTTLPLRTAEAVKDLVLVDLPAAPGKLPSRDVLMARVHSTVRRHLNIDIGQLMDAARITPSLREFAADVAADQRARVIDIVGRAVSRLSRDSTNDAVREDLDTDAWEGAVGELSRTHSTSVLNAATERAAMAAQDRDNTVRLTVTWASLHDGHTREAHRHADGQEVPLGSTFTVGGEQLRFPGDPLGSVENTIQCRCWLFASSTRTAAHAADASGDAVTDHVFEQYHMMYLCHAQLQDATVQLSRALGANPTIVGGNDGEIRSAEDLSISTVVLQKAINGVRNVERSSPSLNSDLTPVAGMALILRAELARLVQLSGGIDQTRTEHDVTRENRPPNVNLDSLTNSTNDLSQAVARFADSRRYVHPGRTYGAYQSTIATPAVTTVVSSAETATPLSDSLEMILSDSASLLSTWSDINPAEFNWIDDCGGLPKYIRRISKHLRDKGMPQSQAIATAVNAAKKMCATGDTNFPGKQDVNPGSRAEACSAVTEWEKLKECAARKRAQNVSASDAFAADTMSALADQEDSAMGQYRSFTSVLAVIGTPTDDGRMFAKDIALAFRDFPLPLAWQKMSDSGHASSYTVGVIQSATVQGDQVIGTGYLLNTPEADQAAGEITHGVTGPSVDLGDVSWELRDETGAAISREDLYAMPEDAKLTETVTAGKVLGATLVSIPAFGQTSITLGDMVDVETDQPALVAAAAVQEAARRYSPPVYKAEFFTDPEFDGPTHPHITADGRIMGHLALHNQCHIGVSKRCEVAPLSATDYAWFHTSPPVKTDDGSVAKVGRLTVVTDPSQPGHADTSLSVGPAVAHYDNVGTCFALVHVGEDEHGIWFSGVPAPLASDDMITAGLSAPLSGDWRWVSGNYELVAALAVNTPGYGIVASGSTDLDGQPRALVASLGPCPDNAPLTRADIATIAEQVVLGVRAADARFARAREIMDGYNARRARALLNRIGGQ